MQTEKRFSREAITALRSEINEAGGNEVFVLGYLDNKGRVSRIEVAARGSRGEVLALLKRPAFAGNGDAAGKGSGASPDVLIHNHPSGFLSPSDNDFVIAARAAEGGLGSFIVDNGVENVYVIAEPVLRRVRRNLDADAITAALEEGGAVAARLPMYEVRESQLDLMRLIIRAFNEDSLAAAEAGTGVGKSFAYLLPAMNFALLNDERVVISTATITLQQQLYEKDIPLVASALPKSLTGSSKKIKAVLVKGRANYVCRRRLEETMREPPLDDDEYESLKTIALWAENAETGSRSELSFVPPDGLWPRLCSEPDLCMGMRCPYRERCFVMILRREAADANVLVVNHHLLFADLAARSGGAGYDSTVVLPPFRRVIIDEAHNIEEAATSFFSEEFGRIGIFRFLSRLYRRKRRGTSKSGLLVRLGAFLPPAEASAFLDDAAANGDESPVARAIEKVRETVDTLDEAALELCSSGGVFRLVAPKDEAITAVLKGPLIAFKKSVQSLAGLVRDMLEQLPEEARSPGAANGERGGRASPDRNNSASGEGLVWEIKAIVRHLENAGTLCSAFLEYRENPDKVCWIEKRSGGRGADWAVFTETPLDVAAGLRESLFEPNKTVICVSATLTVGRGENSFDYWKKRCGLDLVDNRGILSGVFPSPFPYDSSVLLAVPRDAPLPAENSFGAFVDRAVADLVEMAGGSALVLFTSYQSLKSAWETSRPRLEKMGLRVLKQGDDDRSRLLKTFVDDKTSVLFATDSFWEGVDAPGETLRLVVLCRLPFRTPNDPVFEARSERLEETGGNSFMELSLPEAVMKFRQGFGRLMRRSSDHGVVAVLDSRLLKKQYGRVFLQSLPETRSCFGELKDVLQNMENFLF